MKKDEQINNLIFGWRNYNPLWRPIPLPERYISDLKMRVRYNICWYNCKSKEYYIANVSYRKAFVFGLFDLLTATLFAVLGIEFLQKLKLLSIPISILIFVLHQFLINAFIIGTPMEKIEEIDRKDKRKIKFYSLFLLLVQIYFLFVICYAAWSVAIK